MKTTDALVILADELRQREREDAELANVIRQAREAAGISQTELAARMCVQAPSVNRLESTRHLPSVRTLRRVADALGMKLKIEFVPKEKS